MIEGQATVELRASLLLLSAHPRPSQTPWCVWFALEQSSSVSDWDLLVAQRAEHVLQHQPRVHLCSACVSALRGSVRNLLLGDLVQLSWSFGA